MIDVDFFKIKHNNIAPKQGRILIAEPFSQDNYFKRSVVLLTEHNKKNSVGFILNNPVDIPFSEIIPELASYDLPISLGGPVHTDRVFFIHTHGKAIPQSERITDDLFWGGDFEVLKMMIKNKKIKKNEVRFFIGYSGWDPSQLETEILKNYWLVTTISTRKIMADNANIWKDTLSNMKDKKYQTWINFPEDPKLN